MTQMLENYSTRCMDYNKGLDEQFLAFFARYAQASSS